MGEGIKREDWGRGANIVAFDEGEVQVLSEGFCNGGFSAGGRACDEPDPAVAVVLVGLGCVVELRLV